MRSMLTQTRDDTVQGGRGSLLLVDDDPAILTGVGMTLERAGYRVDRADSGEAALDRMLHQTFDLVITDLSMDAVTGLDLLRAVKDRYPQTKVMILTGYGNMDSAIEALRLDADDYLLKPCESEEIRFRVARCLEKQEMERRLLAYEHIVPVCCVCKRIRNDSRIGAADGTWMTVEEYMWQRARVTATSTYCPACEQKALKG